jgi:hypothetical protein
MLGAQGLLTWRDLYRVTPTVTRGLGFSGLIQRTAPFSRLLRHAGGCLIRDSSDSNPRFNILICAAHVSISKRSLELEESRIRECWGPILTQTRMGPQELLNVSF